MLRKISSFHFYIKIFGVNFVFVCVRPPMFMCVHMYVQVHALRPEVVFLSQAPCIFETGHLTEPRAHQFRLV